MTQEYIVEGMTCNGCKTKVQSLVEQIAGEGNVNVDLETGKIEITSDTIVPVHALQSALEKFPKYTVSEPAEQVITPTVLSEEDTWTWFEKYRPILTLFAFITLGSLIAGFQGGGFEIMPFMRIFMAGFFLAFSFFKFLDLKGFAQSYAMYDIVAKRLPIWGYIYAGIELLLGLAFAANFHLEIVLWVTLIVMSVSIVGVLQTVLKKQRIQCACLGVVFDLPMSTVTVIEDSLMIAMSAWMLIAG